MKEVFTVFWFVYFLIKKKNMLLMLFNAEWMQNTIQVKVNTIK
jgi:hypothetical protein